MSARLSIVIQRPPPPFTTGVASGAAADFGILFDVLAAAGNGLHYALRRRNRYQVALVDEAVEDPLQVVTYGSYRQARDAAKRLARSHSFGEDSLAVKDLVTK